MENGGVQMLLSRELKLVALQDGLRREIDW